MGNVEVRGFLKNRITDWQLGSTSAHLKGTILVILLANKQMDRYLKIYYREKNYVNVQIYSFAIDAHRLT